ncbi:uncharacterized protein [Oryza sativa Japonica Group]|uniref:uncharacterized protein isoform X2 n=1 Tax=Oryza sativa subsp. japonica TaxID=39947 RepID=UPI00339CB380
MAMAAGELFTRGTEEEEEPGAFPSGMAFWRRHLVEDDMQFSHFYGVGGLKSGATLTRTRRSPPASSRRSAPAPVGTSSTCLWRFAVFRVLIRIHELISEEIAKGNIKSEIQIKEPRVHRRLNPMIDYLIINCRLLVEPMMINHLELMHTTYQSFNGEIEQGICCKLLWPCGVLPEISGGNWGRS